MVKGTLLSGLPSPQGPLEGPVSPVAQPTDTSDHCGLTHAGRAGQLPNGQGLQLPGVGPQGQEYVRREAYAPLIRSSHEIPRSIPRFLLRPENLQKDAAFL